MQITAVLALVAVLITPDPGNTGYNPHESQLNGGTVKHLRLSWTAQPADPVLEGCANAPDPPLVAAGRVIIQEGGGIGARDVRTGERVWLRPGFSLLSRRMVIEGGLLLVTDTNCYSQSNYDGAVSAISLATGVVIWRKEQAGTVDKLVVDGGVAVTHGYCGTCDADRHQVVAYRVATGTKLWSRNSVDLAGEVSAGRRVLLSSIGASGTRAVAVADGKVVWRSKSAWQALSASPSGDRFLVAAGTGFSTVTARTGQVRWSARSAVRSLSTDGRRVYASGAALTAYDAGTGRRIWTRKLPNAGKPIRAGGLLYVTSTGSELAILAPATGRTVAPGGAYRTATDHVVVAGGRLFTTDGKVVRSYAP